MERKPIMPYGEALRLAHEDVERAGGVAPILDSGIGKTLNTTSMVKDEVFRGTYSMLEWYYERVLFSHTRNT